MGIAYFRPTKNRTALTRNENDMTEENLGRFTLEIGQKVMLGVGI